MNIIIVDDEDLALETLERTVKQVVDANITTFKLPQKALEYVKENAVDVAFLDINMRFMTGLELAYKMKAISSIINIIFVTGYSQYSMEAFKLYASDYILKPATKDQVENALNNLRNPLDKQTDKKVRIQCFGNFEVFVMDKPVVFSRTKAKELFAYLVDRQGASVTMGELMAVLWEGGKDTLSRKSNLRTLISIVKKTFEQHGIKDIIQKTRNSISLNIDLVECDYFDYQKGIPYAINKYHGEYMSQFSWADFTNAGIM